MPPCILLVLGRLPSTACRPSASATRPPRRLPCSCCHLPAAGVRHSAHSASPPPASRAAVLGCRPRPPAHLALRALRQSDGPSSLLSSTRRRLRPPSLPARRGVTSLPGRCLPGSLLRCSVLHAFVLGCLPGRCAAVPGTGHPALRASGASLLDRLHCSPGSSALCDCVGLPGIVFAS
jgi:hypothetical protein